GGVRGPTSREEQLLREFGKEIFRVLFKECKPIEDQYSKCMSMVGKDRGKVLGLRLKLRIDVPHLAQLPWEYLNDGVQHGYICLRTPPLLIRFREVPEPPPPFQVDGPLNVLGMIANPGVDWGDESGWDNLGAAETERARIDKAIQPLQRKGLINFRWVEGD